MQFNLAISNFILLFPAFTIRRFRNHGWHLVVFKSTVTYALVKSQKSSSVDSGLNVPLAFPMSTCSYVYKGKKRFKKSITIDNLKNETRRKNDLIIQQLSWEKPHQKISELIMESHHPHADRNITVITIQKRFYRIFSVFPITQSGGATPNTRRRKKIRRESSFSLSILKVKCFSRIFLKSENVFILRINHKLSGIQQLLVHTSFCLFIHEDKI